MNYFIIKIIALIIMTIDHIAFALLDNNLPMRLIGRIAFPLFCFLLVNGFSHTSNKAKYFLRLFAFSLISEICFDLCFFNKLELGHQNVYFTLSLAFLMLIIFDKTIKCKISKYLKAISILFTLIFFCFFNNFIKADYHWFGILLIVFMYFSFNDDSLKDKIKLSLSIIIANIFYALVFNTILELTSCLSVIILLFFKNKKLYINKYVKYFCYIYYPLHMLILYIIKIVLV